MHFAETTRLTSLQGNCLGATFSPDGKRIAFSCVLNHRADIYLMDRDGTNLTRLTDSGEAQGNGSYYVQHFSPDGAHLVGVWVRTDASHKDYINVYLIDLQSGEGHLLTDTGNDSSPSFSPDGRHIVCVSGGQTVHVSARHNRQTKGAVPEIFRMTWDGQERTRLTHTESEPSGARATAPRNLHPCYSPDGSFIAFASSAYDASEEDHFEIYQMRPDGSEQTRLTFMQGSSSYPLWHPNSKQIAFTCWSTAADTRKNKADLYLVNADGSERRCLDESPTVNWLGDFSPDGRFLAFDSVRNGTSRDVPNNWDIFLLEPATGQIHQMTDNAVLDRKPKFSPDGTAILFESERDGSNELYYARIQR